MIPPPISDWVQFEPPKPADGQRVWIWFDYVGRAQAAYYKAITDTFYLDPDAGETGCRCDVGPAWWTPRQT